MAYVISPLQTVAVLHLLKFSRPWATVILMKMFLSLVIWDGKRPDISHKNYWSGGPLVILVVMDHQTSGRESSTGPLAVLLAMDHQTSGRESSTSPVAVLVVVDQWNWKGAFWWSTGSFSGHGPPDQ